MARLCSWRPGAFLHRRLDAGFRRHDEVRAGRKRSVIMIRRFAVYPHALEKKHFRDRAQLVIPAKAGIQADCSLPVASLDSRRRGNDVCSMTFSSKVNDIDPSPPVSTVFTGEET